MSFASVNFLRFKLTVLSGRSFSQRRVIARRFINTFNNLRSNENRGGISNTGTESSDSEQPNPSPSTLVPPKFKVFRDEDAPVIFDVEEERERINLEELNAPQESVDIFEGVNLEHGINGVYDLADLVNLLRQNNVMDVCVLAVPPELVYVDNVVIVSGRSAKHIQATAEIVRRVFKKKRRSGESLPKIEGANSKDWIALDLGNIVLHIFSQQARKLYDLEMLWSVGSEYDDKSNAPVDELTELLAKHSYLAGFQPAEASN